jgi:hypothetical protein
MGLRRIEETFAETPSAIARSLGTEWTKLLVSKGSSFPICGAVNSKPRKNQLYETETSLSHDDQYDGVASVDSWLRLHSDC